MEITIPSDFVKAGQNIFQDDIVVLQNEGEWGTMTDSKSGKEKKILRFDMKLANDEIKTYTMNKTTMANMIGEYGKNSNDWMKKDLKAHVLTQMAFGKPTKVLILTPPHWLTAEKPVETGKVVEPKKGKKVAKEEIPIIDK